MSEGKQPVIFGDGEQVRDYLFVEDVCAANSLALEKGSGEIVNLGWGRGVSVNEIFETLKKLLDFPGDARREEKRPGEIEKIYLDAGLAERILGWRPAVEFEDGLRKTLKWYAKSRSQESPSR